MELTEVFQVGKHTDYKKVASYGPGGRWCPCCGPAPSFRKKADRISKHREKREAMKEEMSYVSESGDNSPSL